ncbi:MAG: hypothetical protein WBF79_16795 [Rhodococcus sp. (in: high G+C Gram-positive bacteria)]
MSESVSDTAADRHTYLEDGFLELRCRRCATAVLVRKSTDIQTSVQWTGSAREECPEIEAEVARGRHPGLVDGCLELRATVADAVAAGDVTIAGAL